MSLLDDLGIRLAGYGSKHTIVGEPYPTTVLDVPGLRHEPSSRRLALVLPPDDEVSRGMFDRDRPLYVDLSMTTACPGLPVLLLRVGIPTGRPGECLSTVYDAPLPWRVGHEPPLTDDGERDLWFVAVLEGQSRSRLAVPRPLTVRRLLVAAPKPGCDFTARCRRHLAEQKALGPMSDHEVERAVDSFYRRYPHPWEAWEVVEHP